MKNVEELKNKMSLLVKERASHKRKINTLDIEIKDIARKIDNLKEPKSIYVNPNSDLISRDIDICLDYIKLNKKCTTKELIDTLNQKLIGCDIRWKRKLLSAEFMTKVGKYIKPHTFWDNNQGKSSTIWQYKENKTYTNRNNFIV